jgi:hypothetical protein
MTIEAGNDTASGSVPGYDSNPGSGLEDDEQFEANGLSIQSLSAVTTTTFDWTIGSLVQLLDGKNINISPKFQRRDVWDIVKKSRYIESLILHLPVPQLVLAEMPGKRSSYIVLDGRQRLVTIMQFLGLKSATEDSRKQFRLTDLDVLKEAAQGKNWAELSTDPDLQSSLMNASVRTILIGGWKSNAIPELIFTRLNTGSVKLNAQELRLARYSGEFVDLVDEFATGSAEIKRVLGLSPAAVDPRMQDDELVLRYLGFKNRLESYSGPMAPFLDETCSKLTETCSSPQGKELIRAQLDEMNKAIQLGFELLGDSFGMFLSSDGLPARGRRNRAVLDCQIWVLSQLSSWRAEDRALAEKALRDPFRNAEFVDSVAATPRHKMAATYKFRIIADQFRTAGLLLR